ncbi:hypothetical protein D9M68_830540 [compost metagenome]
MIQVQRHGQRGQGGRGRREARAGVRLQGVLIDVGQVQRPAAGIAARGLQAVAPGHDESGAGQAFEAFVGRQHHGVYGGQVAQVQGQRAEGGHGVDDDAAAQGMRDARQFRHVVADATAGFAVDQRQVRQ